MVCSSWMNWRNKLSLVMALLVSGLATSPNFWLASLVNWIMLSIIHWHIMANAINFAHLFLSLLRIDQAFSEWLIVFAPVHLYLPSSRGESNNILPYLRRSCHRSPLTSKVLEWSVFLTRLLYVASIALSELAWLLTLWLIWSFRIHLRS